MPVTTSQINESTGVSLKVLIGVATGILVPLVSGFFWVAMNVAEIKTTLISMQALQLRAGTEAAALDKKLVEHVAEDSTKWQDIERRVTVIEKSGSEKAHELEKRLNEMDIQFRVHVAMPK